jgi:OMF family outer membrane factor
MGRDVVKRQQLFNIFWLASTTVVLVTQTVWADTVPGTAVRLDPTDSGIRAISKTSSRSSPPVFTSSYGLAFSANVINAKLHFLNGGTASRFSNPTDGFTRVTIMPSNAKRVTAQQRTPSGERNRAPDTRNEVAPPANSDDRTQRPQIPGYLDPNPNPLQFPATTEEIRIRGTQPITLEQAFELARRNNRDLQVAELTLERSRSALREALAAEYPSLSVGANLANQGVDLFSNQGQRINNFGQTNQQFQQDNDSSSTSTSLDGTVSLSYDLYTAGERRANIRASEEQLRFDQLDFERVAEQLRLDVANDYYDLQAADESVRISQAAVANAQASLRDAQALEQAGVGTRFDVLRAQVQLADETQNLTNSVRQQQVERRQLAQRLSLSQSVNVSAADPVEIAGLWNLALDDSIVLAFQNRAELEQQLALRNQSEQRRRIALSNLGPTVSLTASYSPNDTLNDEENFRDNYSLGANVSLLLFDGGASRSRARQEEANIAIAEANFANQRNLIRFGVEEAYANLQSNLLNIQTASVALEQAREALRLARLRFQAGVGTQTDVIAAENDLTEAEGDRVTAILDYNRSLATLQRAVSSGQPR